MDIFEEIVAYKKNVKEAVRLFAIISAMNTQMNEAFDKLIPIMTKMQSPPPYQPRKTANGIRTI